MIQIVVVGIYRHSDHSANHPVVWQRLRPQRIHLEARSLHCGGFHHRVVAQEPRPDPQRQQSCDNGDRSGRTASPHMVHLSVESIATAVLALFLAAPVAAHDIPVDATVQAFVKPQGDRLHLLVRVPLETMRDVDVPVDPRGFLDLDKLAPMMPAAATLWISNFVHLYEGDDYNLPRQLPGRCDSDLRCRRTDRSHLTNRHSRT